MIESAARKARIARWGAVACLVFAAAVLVGARLNGYAVHWTSWLMLSGFTLNAGSLFISPPRPAYHRLFYLGTSLLVIGLIGLLIARP
jgi:hypothetical protein